MNVVYSRDHIIGPLGGLVRMIRAIRDRSWDPDCSRAVLLRASLSAKDAGGAIGDAAIFNFVAKDAPAGSGSKNDGQAGDDGNDLYDPSRPSSEAEPEAGTSAAVEDQSEPSDQSSTISSDSVSDVLDYEDAEVEHVDHREASSSSKGGPYFNDKSGITHEAGDSVGISRCGVVLGGFKPCSDLAEAVSLGVLCKRCYPFK